MDSTTGNLDHRIRCLLNWNEETPPTADITAGLRVADRMESKGYAFSLTDLCPRSLDANRWQAVFALGDTEFAAQDEEGAVAICTAAADALEASGEN